MSLKFTDESEQLSFSGPTTAITTTYAPATSHGEIFLGNVGDVTLLVDYDDGDETTLEFLLEFSPDVAHPIAVPATGVDYYTDTAITGSPGVPAVFEYQVGAVALAKWRIPVAHKKQEQIMRISVKRTGGSDAGAGSIKFKVVDNGSLITSALAGRQP
jgi:hypothetical protein